MTKPPRIVTASPPKKARPKKPPRKLLEGKPVIVTATTPKKLAAIKRWQRLSGKDTTND